jgi:hypothetical protein
LACTSQGSSLVPRSFSVSPSHSMNPDPQARLKPAAGPPPPSFSPVTTCCIFAYL